MKWLIVLFCFAIGIAALYYGIKLISLYRKVKGWSRQKATVIHKAVINKRLSQSSRASKTVSIEYTYRINGTEYKNNKVFLVELLKGEKGFTPGEAQKFLESIGSEIEIYVDAANPSNAIIYSDGIGLYGFMVLAGIIMLLVGTVNLFN